MTLEIIPAGSVKVTVYGVLRNMIYREPAALILYPEVRDGKFLRKFRTYLP